MMRLVRIIFLVYMGVINRQVLLLLVNSSGNLLGTLYCQLPMVRKDIIFGGKLQSILLGRKKLNYTDIFMEKN